MWWSSGIAARTSRLWAASRSSRFISAALEGRRQLLLACSTVSATQRSLPSLRQACSTAGCPSAASRPFADLAGLSRRFPGIGSHDWARVLVVAYSGQVNCLSAELAACQASFPAEDCLFPASANAPRRSCRWSGCSDAPNHGLPSCTRGGATRPDWSRKPGKLWVRSSQPCLFSCQSAPSLRFGAAYLCQPAA